MNTKHPIIVDLLDDSSDEEDKVEVIETRKKAAKMPPTAKTPATAAAVKRAQQKSNNLMDLSVAELKNRLSNRGISTQGCLEKADLVHRLENGTAAAMKVDAEFVEDKKVSASKDPFGPLKDGETTMDPAGKYKIKRTGQVYYCTCPAWKFQRVTPAQGRTCKHINALRAGFGQNHVAHHVPPSKKTGSKKRADASATSGTKSKKAKTTIEVALAETYKPEKHDPTGYYLSEKLDGMRCVWDGSSLWSRNGNEIPAPKWFVDALPKKFCLDGELFLGRERFQELMSIKGNPNDPRWSQTKLVIFDAPKVNGDFPARLEAIKASLKSSHCPDRIAYLLEQTVCTGKAHLDQEHERIIALKGEGIILRNPTAPYEGGRTKNLLKLKRWHDAEARVVGYQAGKGKHAGRLGALKCEMIPSRKAFNIGTGFKDAERDERLYPIGSTVTYTYQALTDSGIPRFPKYLRERSEE